MSQRYVRGKFLFAGLILVAVAVAAIALYFARGRKQQVGSLLGYLGKQNAALLFVDVNKIRASGLLERLAGSTVAEEPEYKSFVQQTGFDYKRDLDQVSMSTDGTTHYFVLQGRFDWTKLKGYAVGAGGKCDDDYCFTAGSTPGRVISWYSPARNLMALASAKSPDAARQLQDGPADLAFVPPQDPVWLNIPASVLQKQEQLPSGMRLFAKALETSHRAMMTLGPKGEAYEAAIDVTCKSPEDAAVLKAQLEAITGLLQKFISREKLKPNPGDLSGVLSSGAFVRTGDHVIGRWPIQRAFVDSLGGS